MLVCGRHVGAHRDGPGHGVSIQISINLRETFLRISCLRKIAATWILVRGFAYLLSFFYQTLDFIYWTVLIFISVCFEWRDTESWNVYPVYGLRPEGFDRGWKGRQGTAWEWSSKKGILSLTAFPFPLSSASEPLHRQKRRAGLIVCYINSVILSTTATTWNKKKHTEEKQTIQTTTLNKVHPCQPTWIF